MTKTPLKFFELFQLRFILVICDLIFSLLILLDMYEIDTLIKEINKKQPNLYNLV